jgi:hypothetical protein
VRTRLNSANGIHSVAEPPHTRKVTGSIPVGTTIQARCQRFARPDTMVVFRHIGNRLFIGNEWDATRSALYRRTEIHRKSLAALENNRRSLNPGRIVFVESAPRPSECS